ncbi:MAG: Mannitol dehydrogenase domain, partial [Thermoleophilia bacterium]|nr:Mannitol dehydrogenase domain [Thermoleophilia bacterium]
MPSTYPHRLTRPALTELPRSLQVPNYDPDSLVPAIVHIGVGGFHRAHQAVYLDDLACRGERAWGEIGVCLRRPEMRERLEPQDNLFTVVAHDQSASEARVVGAMSCCLYAPDDPEAVLDALTDPRTRVVTLTITGTAYHVDEWAGRFDATAPEVVADLADPTHPSSAFGYLAEALDRRRRAGTAPFTVLSCDNLQDNGAAAHTALCGFAHLRDPELAEWIDTNVAFPSCMV